MTPTLSEMNAEQALQREVLAWCLSQRRLSRHLTQDQLADAALISKEHVQQVEDTHHDIDEGVKMRLCWALGISVTELAAEMDRVNEEWKSGGRPQAAKRSKQQDDQTSFSSYIKTPS